MLRFEAEISKRRGISKALKNGVDITGISDVFKP